MNQSESKDTQTTELNAAATDASVEAMHKEQFYRGSYISQKIKAMQEEKKSIAERAVKYVKDFDAVLLDAGSTVEIVAQKLFREKKYLTVLTNNMGVYVSFTQTDRSGKNDGDHPSNLGNKLMISGGEYVDVYESLLGKGALDSIRDFTPNVTIIGTSGLRYKEGIFCHGSEESAVKSLLWTMSTDTLLIVTDWSKIGKRDAYAFGNISQLRRRETNVVIVTNRPSRDLFDKPKSNELKEFEKEKELWIKKGIIFDDGTEER